MAGTLTLSSWPGTTGDPSISYLDHYLEQFQFRQPPGVLPSRADDILGSYTNELLVIADSSGMQVKVYQGRATAKGLFAKIPDASVSGGVYTLTVTSAHATLQRVDRVVFRFDLTNGSATLRMVDGTAATTGTAVPTALTQSATTWDVPLALVIVDPAVSTIAPVDVFDKRVFSYSLRSLMEALAIENPIIDGGMEVWPDGTSFSSIADGTYGPAMWRYGKSGAVVHDLLQTADVPAVGELTQKDNYCLHLDVTTADASLAAGDFSLVEQRIEGRRAKRLLQRGFSIPLWVKDSVIGPHAVAFVNSGGDRSFVFQFFLETANTWELHWAHVPASPTAGTWDYTTGIGLRVVFPQAVGSTFQTASPGSWVVSSSPGVYGTSRTVNSNNSTSNNFKLWGVGPMTLGGIILPFSPRDDEAALVKRYYEVIGGNATVQPFGFGFNTATSSASVNVEIVEKRAVPTISVSSVTHFMLNPSNTVVATLTLTVGGLKTLAIGATVSGTPLANQGPAWLLANSTLSARLKIDARL